jgi:hypothetical protein
MSGRAASCPELCVCMGVFVRVVSFCIGALVPLFLLFSITICSSPVFEKKNINKFLKIDMDSNEPSVDVEQVLAKSSKMIPGEFTIYLCRLAKCNYFRA